MRVESDPSAATMLKTPIRRLGTGLEDRQALNVVTARDFDAWEDGELGSGPEPPCSCDDVGKEGDVVVVRDCHSTETSTDRLRDEGVRPGVSFGFELGRAAGQPRRTDPSTVAGRMTLEVELNPDRAGMVTDGGWH